MIKMQHDILIVEDDVVIGQTSTESFELCGFKAVHFTTPEDTLKYLKRNPCPGIVVLDMNLEHPEFNGAQLGLKIRRMFRDNPPEFLIYSAYDKEVSYMKGALDLDVAVYLSKVDDDLQSLISHVRVLSVRNNIRNNWNNILRDTQKIVAESRDIGEATMKTVSKILLPQMSKRLAMRLCFFITHDDETVCLDSKNKLPQTNPVFNRVQHYLSGVASWSRWENIETEVDKSELIEGDHFENMVFLPLHNSGELKLSLGMQHLEQQGEVTRLAFPETPTSVVKVIARYLRNTLSDRILTSLNQQVVSEQGRRQLQQSISSFCSYVGHFQEQICQRALDRKEIQEGPVASLLKGFGKELTRIGQVLNFETPRVTVRSYKLKRLITEAWEDLKTSQSVEKKMDLEIADFDIQVLGRGTGLYLSIKNVLIFLAALRTPGENHSLSKLAVDAKQDGDWCCLEFQHDGPRLPNDLRNILFKPLNQEIGWHQLGSWVGLFTAKMIIEGEMGGRLRDHTDLLKGVDGHLLVATLPCNNDINCD